MKFLIIDGNGFDRAQTIKVLRHKFIDADIEEVASAEDFGQKITQTGFDLVITEYQLGWTDGLTLFNEIHKRYACLPVMMLTGSGNEDIAVAAIKQGLADYLGKHNSGQLVARVARCLAENKQKDPCKGPDDKILLCEKWDLAISRLISDFAYSLRITDSGEAIIDWATEPFKQFIATNASLAAADSPAYVFGLAVHADDRAVVAQRFETLLAGHEDMSEYRVLTAENKHCYFIDHALPIRNQTDGKVVRIYGAIQDVTKQRLTEEKVNLMQHAISSSNNGILITGLADTDFGIIYANEAFLRLSGYTVEELLGRNPRMMQKDDRKQPDISELLAALKSERDGYAVLRNYRKDGSLFWNEIYISPIRNQKGQITHFVGVQNDVTNRINMEELLRKNESKLRTILDNVLDGIIIIDEHGHIQTLNPSAEMIFGYQAEELVGYNFDRLLSKPDRRKIESYMASHVKVGSETRVGREREVLGVKKEGSCFPMDLGVSKISIDHRHLFIATIHDLTERKQIEEELRELSRHLQSAREEERTRIAREIHDQLGSILAALKMDLSWLGKLLPESAPDCHEKVTAINGHIDDAIQTVRQIATDLRPSILDHLGLLAAIDWQVENFRQQTGMQCFLTMPEISLEMDGDRVTAVFRIMQEALTNIAVHAQASKVMIDIKVDEDNLVIKIADNGIGITPSQLNKPHAYGVQGMYERAYHFGGEVRFISQPGLGTQLLLAMPQQSSKLGGAA